MKRLGVIVLLTYVLHIAEEYFGGFPAWASAVTGLALTEPVFLRLNAIFLAVMAVGVLAGFVRRTAEWLVIPLGTAVLINGTAHVVASIVTWSYSPGVLTGGLLWIPLGIVIIRTALGRWPRSRVMAGIGLGAGLHLLAPLSAYLAARGR